MTYNTKYKIFYIIILLSIPLSLVAAYYTSWWWLLAGFIWSRVIGVIFVGIGLHRYFSHRSFKTGKKRHLLLALGSIFTGSGSPISWATHHVHHHKYSDQDLDLHRPADGILHSVLWWPIHDQEWFMQEKKVKIPMFVLRDKISLWVHNNYFFLCTIWALLLFLIDWKIFLFLFLFSSGLSVMTGNLVTNTLLHLDLPGSYRNFQTSDNSYNNQWIQFFLTGEGYHNNHHAKMNDYNHAKISGEFDFAAWIIDRFFKID